MEGWVDLVTRKRRRRESNSRPLGPESNALTTEPPTFPKINTYTYDLQVVDVAFSEAEDALRWNDQTVRRSVVCLYAGGILRPLPAAHLSSGIVLLGSDASPLLNLSPSSPWPSIYTVSPKQRTNFETVVLEIIRIDFDEIWLKCSAHPAGLGRDPSRDRIWCILALKL